MAHNHQSTRSPDCPNSTKIVQLNPYRFSFSLTSAALNKQEGKSLEIWEPKQTGKILQLYITKGMTENPINKLTPSRFITTKPVRSSPQMMRITSFLHHKQNNPSKLQTPSIHQNSCANQMEDLGFHLPPHRLHSAFSGLSADIHIFSREDRN